jgi:hypothetical protein
MARQPHAWMGGSHAGLPPALAYTGETLARLVRTLHGYINGRGSGEGRISEVNEAARKFKEFQDVCVGGSVSTAEGRVTKLTSHGKPRRRRVQGSWTVSSSSSLDVGGSTGPSGRHRHGWRERRTKGFRTAWSRRSAIVGRPRASWLQSTCRCRSRSRSRSGGEGCQDPPLVSW